MKAKGENLKPSALRRIKNATQPRRLRISIAEEAR